MYKNSSTFHTVQIPTWSCRQSDSWTYLITLHSAKGLEFDAVVMMGMDQGKVPRWDATSTEDISEARRLFYVGLTRAKEQIHMTFSGFTENQYGRRFIRGPSVILTELQQKLDAEQSAT